jgi:hypothetical protein
MIRSYLKKVFCPNLCVGPSFQLLEILEYACGLKLGPALTLSQNPIFEMASSSLNQKKDLFCPIIFFLQPPRKESGHPYQHTH